MRCHLLFLIAHFFDWSILKIFPETLWKLNCNLWPSSIFVIHIQCWYSWVTSFLSTKQPFILHSFIYPIYQHMYFLAIQADLPRVKCCFSSLRITSLPLWFKKLLFVKFNHSPVIWLSALTSFLFFYFPDLASIFS